MRIDLFDRECIAQRKLDFNKALLNLQTAENLMEFMKKFELSILKILDAHAIEVYERDDENSVIFGDRTSVLTDVGRKIINSKCKMNSMVEYTSFKEGLTGDGAGLIFSKQADVSIAIIRKSEVHDVCWGGNPDKSVAVGPQERLQPRASFDIFVEKARVHCKVWSAVDLELAQYFIERVSNYVHGQMLASFRLSLEQSNAECLQAIESNKEHTEFFAHMSHELRTPFHGVMSSLQILDNGGESLSKEDRKEIIESALECKHNVEVSIDSCA
jgi:hypothetical protein